MPGADAGTARLRPTEVRAALAALAGPPLDDLLLFHRLRKWTIPLFAEYWETGDDTARRALRRLHEVGVVGCLQGQIHGTGGRDPDLYFLNRLGARVLTRALGLPPAVEIRAPTVALDAGVITAGGLVKHKVAAKPGQDAHDLACLALAVHQGWLNDPDWHTREALRYTGRDGQMALLVPDFFRRLEDELWCVEVEGTTEAQHIRAKHRRYGALFADYRRRERTWLRCFLTVVLRGEAAREPILRLHERAYVTQEYAYGLDWGTLDAIFAVDSAADLNEQLTQVDYQAVRDWWREHHERQLRALSR